MGINQSGTKLPTVKVAERYSVTTRSIERWKKNPELRFPKPIGINKRWYWELSDLETWERARAASPTRKTKASAERDGAEAAA
jgi:hypothetical protein